MVATLGENTTDTVSIIITIERGVTASGYKYLQPIEWRNAGEYEAAFTVKGGNDFDFVYCGEWTGGTVDDDDYQDGFFNHMLLNYDSVYLVTSVSDYSRSLLPHLEVIGK
ncbi:MAG: hypothetical protein IJM76_05940 [Lachnospiraceae bacterium]|nr:hypothetical protein [Lachnospiraceae bacterium]